MKLQILDKSINKIKKVRSENIKGFPSQVKSIHLGEIVFEKVSTIVIRKGWYKESEIESRKGSIGGCLLSKYSVTFDYFNEKIYLKNS